MSGSELWNSVLLGVIQGIAEFLPISSSGHLVLSQELLGIAPVADEASAAGLQINIALHLGTLGSIIAIYWHDVLALMDTLGTAAPGILGALVMGGLIVFTQRRILEVPDYECPPGDLAADDATAANAG